jgi:diacylglycerol kinase family enzyme
VIVAAGGDGTLNAIVNGLAAAPPRPVALLPFGTANVLARDLGLPRNAEALAELIVNGPVRPVWPGRIGERLFMATASCGFDAEAVAALAPGLKRRFGRVAFAVAILKCLLRYRECRISVATDSGEYRATTVIAARSRFYGGPFVVAPGARLDEPILDLILFQRGGRRAVMRYLAALLLNRMPRLADAISLRSRTVSLAAAVPVPMQLDGEPAGFLPVALGIADRPLLFVRP